MKIELKTYKVKSIAFVNNMKNGAKIELANNFSYNVRYSENNICKGEMTVELKSKADDDFKIKTEIEGIFSYEGAEKQEDIHKATFTEMYAYARAIVTTITANAGIPPIFLPSVDINNQSIYKISDKDN